MGGGLGGHGGARRGAPGARAAGGGLGGRTAARPGSLGGAGLRAGRPPQVLGGLGDQGRRAGLQLLGVPRQPGGRGGQCCTRANTAV